LTTALDELLALLRDGDHDIAEVGVAVIGHVVRVLRQDPTPISSKHPGRSGRLGE